MLILTIRTDKPKAEIGLFNSEKKLDYATWQANRQLSETIHTRIKSLLVLCDYNLKDLQGVITFKGPGSFTGLRIGISIANALADSLKLPIAGAISEDWVQQGLQKLQSGGNDRIVLPLYGAPPHTTQPKK